MKLDHAEDMAIQELEKHSKLGEWVFLWFDRKTTVGMCSYKDKAIFLSKTFVRLSDKNGYIQHNPW